MVRTDNTDGVFNVFEIVDVNFFDENLRTVRAWKKKDSEVYKLLDFESDINHRTKGYECDWSPHIGKIG